MSDEKTELPTAQRMRELRRKGDVARSQDATTAGVLVAGLVAVVIAGPGVAEAFLHLLRASVQAVARTSAGGSLGDIVELLAEPARELAAVAALLMLAIALGGGVVAFLQIGPLWASRALALDAERFSPVANIGRVWTKRSMLELLRTILKIVIALAVCYGVLRSDIRGVLATATATPAEALRMFGHCAWRLAFFIAVLAVAIGALDLLYQRHSWLQQHRMSKVDVKRDHEQQEGDGQIKQARRAAHEEIALGQMLDDIDGADTLVRNPIHLAVVLRFDVGREKAPRIVAKGRGQVARKIIARARKAGLAEQYDIRLARALHRLPVQSTIPEELFDAVSALLAWAESELQRNGRVPGWRKSPDESPQRNRRHADK